MLNNLALLKSVPAIDDAHLERTASLPQLTGDGEARIASYRTTRIYNLPHGKTPADALRFYRDELGRRGWRVVTSGVDHVNLGRGDAYLHVLAGRGRVYVAPTTTLFALPRLSVTRGAGRVNAQVSGSVPQIRRFTPRSL